MGRVEIASVLSILLFGLYLGWGIYLLHLRINRHRDLNPVGEVATLGGLILFFTFELALFQIWFQNDVLLMAVAVMGLTASGLALYGPMMMSLASHALVGMVMPSGHAPSPTPHLGVGEKYEENEDYEGALREYLAVAQTFPNDTRTALRVAKTLVNLERYQESIGWFERGMIGIDDADQCLVTVTRVVDIAVQQLEDIAAAERVLLYFIERFPNEESTGIAKRRLNRLEELPAQSAKGFRAKHAPEAFIEETPLINVEDDIPPPEPKPKPKSKPEPKESTKSSIDDDGVSYLDDSSLDDIVIDDDED